MLDVRQGVVKEPLAGKEVEDIYSVYQTPVVLQISFLDILFLDIYAAQVLFWKV